MGMQTTVFRRVVRDYMSDSGLVKEKINEGPL